MAYQVVGTQVQRMFSGIAHRYDLTNSVLSMGVHHLWRQALLRRVPKLPHGVALDACTGTGVLIPLLQRRVGKVYGVDFCLPMLRAAPSHVRAPLLAGDALRLPFRERVFDVVTVAFGVRNLERLEDGLRELRRVVRDDGVLLVLEFGQPRGLMGPLFRFYSRVFMPFIGGLLTGDREAYAYLPRTSSRFPCGDEFLAIARRCGFQNVAARPLTSGIAWLYELRP